MAPVCPGVSLGSCGLGLSLGGGWKLPKVTVQVPALMEENLTLPSRGLGCVSGVLCGQLWSSSCGATLVSASSHGKGG
jgi:hypothetical protein